MNIPDRLCKKEPRIFTDADGPKSVFSEFCDFDHATSMREISAAYRSGKLEHEILDRAVSRVLVLKFQPGLFNRPETDPKLRAMVCRC